MDSSGAARTRIVSPLYKKNIQHSATPPAVLFVFPAENGRPRSAGLIAS